MDIVKNGESSTSPRPSGGDAPRSPRTNGQAGDMTRLVMPQFDSMSPLDTELTGRKLTTQFSLYDQSMLHTI